MTFPIEKSGADFHHSGQAEQREGKDRHHVAGHAGPGISVEGSESRHESRIEPALAHHAPHKIGQPERRQKRIRHRPCAKRLREQHVPGESQDPRRARAEADQKR